MTNNKLRHAIYAWLHTRCIEGFGEVYCGDLLSDFVDFLKETRMLRGSPGRIVFGKELARLGFEKRKVAGLTFWAGIRLKNQSIEQATRPHQYAVFLAKQRREQKVRNEMPEKPETDQKKKLAEFHARLKAEERKWERIRNGEIVF